MIHVSVSVTKRSVLHIRYLIIEFVTVNVKIGKIVTLINILMKIVVNVNANMSNNSVNKILVGIIRLVNVNVINKINNNVYRAKKYLTLIYAGVSAKKYIVHIILYRTKILAIVCVNSKEIKNVSNKAMFGMIIYVTVYANSYNVVRRKFLIFRVVSVSVSNSFALLTISLTNRIASVNVYKNMINVKRGLNGM